MPLSFLQRNLLIACIGATGAAHAVQVDGPKKGVDGSWQAAARQANAGPD